MEGTSSWKHNDWRTQLEPDLRKKVILAIVEKLKKCFPGPGHSNGIKQTALTFEEKIYGMAKDKGDYLRKIHERIVAFEKKFRADSSANGAHNPDPAHPTSQQQRLPQNNIQSNLNTPNSSGMPTQAPVTFSAGQTPQNMQHQSLLKQPIQQQLPHHTPLSPIKQSFSQSSSLCLPSSGQHNSQFLPRHQIPTQQQVHSSQQQQMAVPSQEHKKLQREKLFSQLVNGQDTQETHLTSPQNIREQQQICRVSTSQQNNMASSQPMMLQQHQPNNPVKLQSHNRILQQQLDDTQRFQAADSLQQSQKLAGQQNQPYQLQRAHQANPSTQDSIGMMVNTSGGDWREETYQKIKALREKHIHALSTMFQRLSDRLQEIDSLPQQKTPHEEQCKNLRAGTAALEQILAFLNVSRSSVSEKHRDRFSLYERQVLKFIKSQREKEQQQQKQVHLHPSQIHQTALQPQSGQVHLSQSLDSVQMNTSCFETSRPPYSSQTRPKMEPKDDNNIMSSSGNVALRSLEHNPQLLQRQQQQQQKEQQTNQQKQQLQIPKNEMNDVRRQRFNSKSSSPHMQKYSSPQQTLNKTESQEHPPLVTLPPEPIAERPIDRLIKAIQSSSPESLAQSASEMSSVLSLTDRFAGSFHSTTRGSRPLVAEDLSERTRLRLQQEDTRPTKRFKRSFITTPQDITSQTDRYKQFSVNKIEPSYALLQEIIEINGRLVETVVNIWNEDVCPSEVTSGLTVVTCTYVPVAISATLKALYNSGHISQIQPLRLQVPENYPYSLIILEKDLLETASVHKYEDLSARARSRFGLSMRQYSEIMSLKEIAKVWDECARATMLEYAERHGGGTFSSKYGRWESVLGAS